MTLTHSFSPLPVLIEGQKDRSKLKEVSREWIYLSLVNNYCMGTYAILKNLHDSILGSLIGTSITLISRNYQSSIDPFVV